MNPATLAAGAFLLLLVPAASADIGVGTQPTGFLTCSDDHTVEAPVDAQACVVYEGDEDGSYGFIIVRQSSVCAEIPQEAEGGNTCNPAGMVFGSVRSSSEDDE